MFSTSTDPRYFKTKIFFSNYFFDTFLGAKGPLGLAGVGVYFSHKYKITQGVMVGERQLLVEDDLQWKTTFVGRQPLLEDDLRWKTTFGGPYMPPTPLCFIF